MVSGLPVDIASCPSGGWISDRFGRKPSPVVLLAGSAAGCVFAMVPLIRRSLTGQIAGIVGAYGNIGTVVFLTMFSFVSTPVFFTVIAASIGVAAAAAMFLEEPKTTLVEVIPDGSVQHIDMH